MADTSASSLVEFKDVTFSYPGSAGDRVILDQVTLSVPRGKVTALMGASGGGKTTVLRLIGGQQKARSGTVTFEGRMSPGWRSRSCTPPAGAWACCSSSARSSPTSACSTTSPSRCASTPRWAKRLIRDIVLMKLNAVGLRGARDLMPSEVSGGMARRVALARAIALDPELIMYDEPFAGLDPISLGTAAQLIRELNDTLGITSIVVSHDLEETFRIADKVVILANGSIAAQGTPDEVRNSTTRWCTSSSTGSARGP
jgi:phospholipid/cholesterol/gamma-HCH transport system ATP-binding protein